MVKKIVVKKHFTDEQMQNKEGSFFDESLCKIYNENVDIYSEEGEILVRFRKNVLSDNECKICRICRSSRVCLNRSSEQRQEVASSFCQRDCEFRMAC